MIDRPLTHSVLYSKKGNEARKKRKKKDGPDTCRRRWERRDCFCVSEDRYLTGSRGAVELATFTLPLPRPPLLKGEGSTLRIHVDE